MDAYGLTIITDHNGTDGKIYNTVMIMLVRPNLTIRHTKANAKT